MTKRTFLFITCNKNEQRAFLQKLENQREETCKGGIIVTHGRFGKYDVVHFHSPLQGSEAQMPIMNAIQSQKPDAVILVGIACGANVKNRQQRYGDVLIAKNVIDYDFHKDSGDKTELRGTIVPCGGILYNLFSQRAYRWELENHIPYYCGDMISSTVLMNNLQKKKEIFDLYSNNPVGYEMEGSLAIRICHHYNIHQCILVKGISDFGDGKKKDAYQMTAAENAVSLCHYVFSQDGLNEVPQVFDNADSADNAHGGETVKVNYAGGDQLSGNARKIDFGKENSFGNITINGRD